MALGTLVVPRDLIVVGLGVVHVLVMRDLGVVPKLERAEPPFATHALHKVLACHCAVWHLVRLRLVHCRDEVIDLLLEDCLLLWPPILHQLRNQVLAKGSVQAAEVAAAVAPQKPLQEEVQMAVAAPRLPSLC